MQEFPVVIPAELVVLDDEGAGLDHVARCVEHGLLVGHVIVDGDVGIGARTKVALVGEVQGAGRTGAGNNGYLIERIFTLQFIQYGVVNGLLVDAFDLLPAKFPVHQQSDQLRVAHKGTAIGVIGGQHDAPGIF